ncbi:VWA domain-containing protein [Candidatus Woesearchaeota archaeon]|nr:VWA domain-containing protein [Candidatus Woesearchaeota archaeon]
MSFFIALPLLIIIHFISLKYTKRKALKFANFSVIEKITGKKIVSKNWTLLFMRLIVVSCLILSASGITYWYNARGSDFNYGLLIDASASMTANDFKPSRIDAAKESALRFVDSIGAGTKIGVITFTGTSFVKQRLTDDIGEVKDVIENINIEGVGGTAIGDALVTGSNLFFSGKEGGNVLVLLTDGQSNVGLEINDAIPFLLENKILAHTIGIGTKEGGSFVGDAVTRLDEESLKFIADETGGKYYSAANEDELKKAFSEIAQLRMKRVGKNLTVMLLLIGVGLLLVEWGLMNSKYRSLP